MEQRFAWAVGVGLMAGGLMSACAAGSETDSGGLASMSVTPPMERIDAGSSLTPPAANNSPMTDTSSSPALAPSGPNTDGSSTTPPAVVPPPSGDEVVPPDALPCAVDEWFYPSGYMGDGELGAIEDADVCALDRPADALGTCHRFTWTPPATSMGWAGVYWQHQPNPCSLRVGSM